MRLSDLQPSPGSKHPKKRVGRGPGSGSGKTASRGHKGQRSRSGAKISPLFEGGQMPLARRLPKRGFTNIFAEPWAIVNLRDLQRFDSGTVVDEAALTAAGLVKKMGRGIKVLGQGEISVPLTVKVNAISRQARARIVEAGGQVEVL